MVCPKQTSPLRSAKRAKVSSYQANLIINMHKKGKGYKAIATHYKRAGKPIAVDTVKSILRRYKASGTTSHIVNQRLRRAVSESIRRLLVLRKGKRYARLKLSYREVSDYIADRCSSWKLVKSDLPSRRTLIKLIDAIPVSQRMRNGRKIRTVFNKGISAGEAERLGFFSRFW